MGLVKGGCSPTHSLPWIFQMLLLGNLFTFSQEFLIHKSFSMAYSSKIFSMTSAARHQNILKQGVASHHSICIRLLLLLQQVTSNSAA